MKEVTLKEWDAAKQAHMKKCAIVSFSTKVIQLQPLDLLV